MSRMICGGGACAFRKGCAMMAWMGVGGLGGELRERGRWCSRCGGGFGVRLMGRDRYVCMCVWEKEGSVWDLREASIDDIESSDVRFCKNLISACMCKISTDAGLERRGLPC